MSFTHSRTLVHLATALLYAVMVTDHWAYLALALVHLVAGVIEDDWE